MTYCVLFYLLGMSFALQGWTINTEMCVMSFSLRYADWPAGQLFMVAWAHTAHSAPAGFCCMAERLRVTIKACVLLPAENGFLIHQIH